jgi:hypothetical protein
MRRANIVWGVLLGALLLGQGIRWVQADARANVRLAKSQAAKSEVLRRLAEFEPKYRRSELAARSRAAAKRRTLRKQEAKDIARRRSQFQEQKTALTEPAADAATPSPAKLAHVEKMLDCLDVYSERLTRRCVEGDPVCQRLGLNDD